MIGIYSLVFEDGSRYVGQSKDIGRRFSQHIYQLQAGKHISKLVTAAYEVNGLPELEVLEECLLEELDAKEEYYIHKLGTLNKAKCSVSSPNYYGDNVGDSLYDNETYLAVFRCLCDPTLSLCDVSRLTGVTWVTVNNMARGASHKKWLSSQYPEEYADMLTLKRKKEVGVKMDKYPPVVCPQGVIYRIEGTLTAFAEKFGLQKSNLSAMLNGRLKSVSGWRVANEVPL